MPMSTGVVRGVLLDISGVLYEGERAVPGATETFRRLVGSRRPLRLVTNTTRRPKRVVIERLVRMGFDITPEHLFTAAEAARTYLQAEGLIIYPLIHPALEEEFADLSGPKGERRAGRRRR